MEQARSRHTSLAVLLAAIAVALLVTARFNYLLFHSLAELGSVVVALSVFVIAWAARRYLENAYLLVVGVAYLFLGLLDLVHLLAFPGMTIFAEQRYQANQLWIAARGLEALTFVAAFVFLRARRPPNRWALLAVYATATALILASVFGWKNFPVCFVPGAGQTPFKIAAEYLVIAFLAASLALLWVNRGRFEPGIAQLIGGSIALAICSEVCFTLYTSPYGFSNQVGHFFKGLSYVAIYLALVETCMERPYEIVFRELNKGNERLIREVAARRESETAKEKAIAELRTALDEIRTLRGIIPICSHCKKIRDDEGAWNQLEAYIQRRSSAQFSHGLCPDCLHHYFPQTETEGTDTSGP